MIKFTDFDIVVASPEIVGKYKNTLGYVINHALTEVTVIYG